ncbi:MAG: S9 family peptidase [Gemmatimonadota bacterium]
MRARRIPGLATLVPALAFSWLSFGSPVSPLLGQEQRPRDDRPRLDAPVERDAPDDRILQVADFLDLEPVGSPELSPDGSEIIYARSHVNRIEDSWDSELWIMNADGSRNRFLTEGSSPRWSPDGTRIAYLAEGEPKGTQVFVRWMDAEGATSQITRVTESPSSIEWSPDGRSIAFVMLVPEKESWSIDMPGAPEGAEWTQAPRMITKTHYRQDRRGFMEEGFTHLFVVPADGGTPRQLTRGDWNVGARFSGLAFGAGIDWTPDGAEILFDGLMEESPELDGFGQNYIYAVDVESGEVRQVVSEKGNWLGPVVSPDGSHVAFTGYPFTLQTYTTSELYVAPVAGGAPTKISGDLDRDAGDLRWAPDGEGVYFTAGDRGTQNVHFAAADGSGVRPVTEGTHMLSLSSLSSGGLAVGTVTSPQHPGDVVRLDLGAARDGSGTAALTTLTDVNADILARKELGVVEEIWYESTGGTRVQGWIVKPPDFDESRDYPLILHIHGGPHGMYDVSFSWPYQTFASNGYVVLYTNPRGSTGYGTAFGNAIDDAYPSVDHEDLMAGVDALLARGYVDPNRLYVTGCSGGGVLSSWAIGHTDRFAAAAVRCPVVNWISFAGTADVVQWGYHRFDGYFWDDPTKWLEHSPIMHVGNVTTPTLLMTGELDLRTPMSQTEEYYAALKVLGVEAVMLRFYDEYHGTTSKPSNAMRTQLYLMDWFGKHTKEAPEVSER